MENRILVKIAVSILSGLLGNAAMAQNNSYPTIGNPIIYNYSPSIILQRNTSEGGFTQGIQTKLLDGTDNWYFGTLNHEQFIISKGSYQDPKLTVFNNGYIGIGTTSPSEILHLRHANPLIRLEKAGILNWQLGNKNGNDFAITADNLANPNLAFTIQNSTGHVGIGRVNPSVPLHVQFNGIDSRPGGVTAATAPVLRLSRWGTSNYAYDESAEFRIGHGGNSVWGSQLDLYINGASNQNDTPDQHVMSWLYNGNVGVGTVSPKEKLSVNGKIRAHEIKVETSGWPDYVFRPDYQLPTLIELEKYIKINKHLPGMPTAKEVESDGAALGETVKQLLKNQEQLTLYIIEQQKQIEALKQMLNEKDKK